MEQSSLEVLPDGTKRIASPFSMPKPSKSFNYGLRKIRFGHSRMQPIANDSRAVRLRRAGAPGARQRTCNAPARRCAPRRNRVPVRRAGDAQASKVGSRSAKCFLFDNDHRGAWSALVPFAGGHTILNCISEEIGVLPGALWRLQKCFQKCSRKCSGK